MAALVQREPPKQIRLAALRFGGFLLVVVDATQARFARPSTVEA